MSLPVGASLLGGCGSCGGSSHPIIEQGQVESDANAAAFAVDADAGQLLRTRSRPNPFRNLDAGQPPP